MSKSKIRLTSGEDDEESEGTIVLPRLRTFWIIHHDPETERVEKVTLEAHDVQVYKSGILVFRAWKLNPERGRMPEAPPVIGYIVRGFRDHIGFGEVTTDGVVN